MKTFLISFLIFSLIFYSFAERFSAVEELVNLSENEEKLVEQTTQLIEKLEEFTAKIKSDLKRNEKERKLMKSDSFEYISNPLNALLIIKRLSYDVSQKIQQIRGIAKAFDKRTEHVRLPLSDFEGAVEGLIRLQIMYNLQPEDLAKGIIEDKKYRDDLTANELYALGNELTRTNRTMMSLSYLNLALERNQQQQEMSDVTILELILENQQFNGDKKAMIETIDKILKISPERSDLEELRTSLELEQVFSEDPIEVETLDPAEEKNGSFTPLKELKLLIAACGGKQEKNLGKLSKLKCRLVSKNSFSMLAPFKVEEVHLNPYIAMYHDVISESEIEAFKEVSKSSLSRAQVLNADSSSKV